MSVHPYGLDSANPIPRLPVMVSGMNGATLVLEMLVDTGADATILPEAVAAKLGLTPARYTEISGIAGTRHPVPIYSVEIDVGGFSDTVFVASLGDEAILGRDVLNHLIIELNGPARKLTLHPPRRKRRSH